MAAGPVLDTVYTRVQMFPLHNAVASRNFKEVQNLVADGRDVNEQHYDRVTPLHMACLTGDVQITSFLLGKGAFIAICMMEEGKKVVDSVPGATSLRQEKINAQSIDNSTPLCDACAGGSADCVKMLLDHGALVNPPLLLSTPLHEAALRGYTDIVALLIEAGAKLNVNDLHYGTPLHAVCSMQSPSLPCIRHLLKSGAKVNAIKNHKTPLHFIAMYSKSEEAAQLLLTYGADVYLRDNLGCTAQHLAGPSSALAMLLAAHERHPRPLTQCCRLTIRSHIGPSRLQLIKKLEAPPIVIGYLQ